MQHVQEWRPTSTHKERGHCPPSRPGVDGTRNTGDPCRLGTKRKKPDTNVCRHSPSPRHPGTGGAVVVLELKIAIILSGGDWTGLREAVRC